MKKILALLLAVSILILSGCAGKPGDTKDTAASSVQSSANSNTLGQRVEVKTNFEPLKPGSVPQLSAQQKAEVDTKVNSVLEKVDSALKSIQDPQDIDISSVN